MSDNEIKSIFSQNLNNHMKMNDKSQADLVNDLGFDKSTVSTWCNGTRLPRMDKVDKLASYFHISRSELLEDNTELFHHHFQQKLVSRPFLDKLKSNRYFNKIFAENLKFYMSLNELSLEDLYERLEYDKAKINDWYYGRELPTDQEIMRIGGRLNTLADRLVREKKSSNSYTDRKTLQIIAKRVNFRREMINLTDDQVDERLGAGTNWTKRITYNIEMGELNYMTPRMLEALSKILQTTVEYLVGKSKLPFADENPQLNSEMELIAVYRNLNDGNKELVSKFMTMTLIEQENYQV